MAEAKPAPRITKVLLDVAEKLIGEAAIPEGFEKQIQALHDDEFETLTRDEKRAFWGETVKRELARQGLAKGQIAMSGLGASETPVSVTLAQLEKQDAKCATA